MNNIKPGDTPIIFERSTVNGADNMQHLLPVQPWEWPKGTYLDKQRQRRIEEARKEQGDDHE